MPPVSGRIIKDATKSIQLTITDADIAKGKAHNPSECVFAQACKREIHADEVLIHRTRAYVRKGDVWTRYLVPQNVQIEIVTFDRGGEPITGQFKLCAPTETEKLGSFRDKNYDAGRRKARGRQNISGRKVLRQRITKNVRFDMASGLQLHRQLGA